MYKSTHTHIYIYIRVPRVHRPILEFDGSRGERKEPKLAMRVGLASSSIATVYGPCRCSTATQELRGRGYQFMRCNIVGTRAGSSSRCREEVPEDRDAGRNSVAERRVPCKTVLEVNDNSGRRIPGRLTFERKEPRLKLYASDSSARFPRSRSSSYSFRPSLRFSPAPFVLSSPYSSSSSSSFRADISRDGVGTLSSLSLSSVILHPRDRKNVIRRVGSMTRSE